SRARITHESSSISRLPRHPGPAIVQARTTNDPPRRGNMIRKRVLFTTIAAGATVLATAAFHTDNHPHLSVARTDFAHTVTPTTPAYLAQLPPLDPAPVKEFRIPIMDAKLHIAPGISYEGWTFGGTVPGPVMHVRQGDLVRITVVNETPMPHSIDFHAARVPANVAYRAIMPRDSLQFEFTATDPGAFLVHCGTPPVLMHLMQGMYMTMIVDPRDGWGTKADHEFVLVQSEFYAKDGPGGTDAQPDYAAAQEKEASQVVFNGRAFQYKDHPLHVNVGDRVRLYVVNAGPSLT